MSRGIYGIGNSINDYANQQIAFMSDQEKNRLQRQQIAAQIDALKQKTAAMQQNGYQPNATAFERDWKLYSSASPEVQQQMERFKRGDPLRSKGFATDPNTGGVVPLQGYDDVTFNRQNRERQTGILAEDQAKARLALPKLESNTKSMADLANRLINHEGFSSVVGRRNLFGGAVPFSEKTIAGTEAAGFMQLYKQFVGKQSLEAYQNLKGAGAITQAELEPALAAQSAINTSLNEEEFINNTAQFLESLKGLEQLAKERINTESNRPTEPQPTDSPNNGVKKGLIINGYYFLGGDETDPNNYRRLNR